jgi:DNA adenine methylase
MIVKNGHALLPCRTVAVPQPFVKWAGGKGQLLTRLAPWVPLGTRYLEPFVGGGALFFHLRPAVAVLSDRNAHLMACYQMVRDDVEALISLLREYRERHSEAFYYGVRKAFNSLEMSAQQRAAAFVYLNKTGFNGLYRENSRGEHNVPFGRYRNPAIFDEAVLRADAHALATVELRSGDFAETAALAREGDFVYFDPPYHPVSATARFTAYTRDAFDEREQARLAEVYRALDARGCRLLLSNSDTPLIRKLYKGFRQTRVAAVRAINCVGSGRGTITELVIRNYALRPGRGGSNRPYQAVAAQPPFDL